ncbi:hypothetical protein ABKN59_010763 [Abortiporus biennis]
MKSPSWKHNTTYDIQPVHSFTKAFVIKLAQANNAVVFFYLVVVLSLLSTCALGMDIFTYYFYTLASSTFPIVLCIVGFSPLSLSSYTLFLDFFYSSFPPLRLSHSLFSSSLFIILGLGYDSLGFIFHFHHALFCIIHIIFHPLSLSAVVFFYSRSTSRPSAVPFLFLSVF